MLLFAEEVSLWAPSARQMTAAGSVVTPQGVLDLLEAGKLQIVGREPWLMQEESRRKSAWKLATWTEGFDDRVRDIALREEEQGIDPEQRRVRVAPPERGWGWAETQIEEATEVATRTRDLIEKSYFPEGMMEKARDAAAGSPEDPDAAVKKLLRDMRNHEDALELLGGPVPVEPSLNPNTVPHLMERRPPALPEAPAPDLSKLWELMRIAAELTPPMDTDSLLELTSREDLAELRDEIGPHLCAAPRQDLAEEIESQVRSKRFDRTWKNVITPDTVGEKAGLAVGFADLVMEIATHRLLTPSVGALMAALGVSAAAISPGAAAGRKVGLLRTTAREYDGPRWPFVLAYGRSDPRYKEIERMLARLRELRRS